jgi:hypothetical protein
MTETVTWESYAGPASDGYGGATYGTPQDLQAHIVWDSEEVRDANGNLQTTRSKFYVAGHPGITTQDRVTLPDGEKPAIIRVNYHTGIPSLEHEEVFVT